MTSSARVYLILAVNVQDFSPIYGWSPSYNDDARALEATVPLRVFHGMYVCGCS